jgi:hypothetical protein
MSELNNVACGDPATTSRVTEQADERAQIVDSIDAIIDSCAIFKRTAEGKAIRQLLAGLRTIAQQAVDASPVAAREALASASCGTFECRAGQKDGTICADDECDIASGVRAATTATKCEHFYSFHLCLKCGYDRSAPPAATTASASGEYNEPQERARFAAWVKEDRIPNIQRKHHWKTWLRAIGRVDQDKHLLRAPTPGRETAPLTDAVQYLQNVAADAVPMLSHGWPKTSDLLKGAVAQVVAALAQQGAAK